MKNIKEFIGGVVIDIASIVAFSIIYSFVKNGVAAISGRKV